MTKQLPRPPSGIGDLNSQPGLESDASLDAMQSTLESRVPDDLFARLTRFVDEDVPGEATEEFREEAWGYVTECIEYRDEIRPGSLREQSELPEGIGRITVGGWVWYRSGADDVEHDRAESEADTFEHGKYLFFAPDDPRVLEDIMLEQFQMRPFRSAKLPTIPGKREDWVLCLYQDDNRYWYDLREAYHNPPRVRFRGFKTDAATRRGEYSEQFERSGSM